MAPRRGITQAFVTDALALGGVEWSGAQRPRRHGDSFKARYTRQNDTNMLQSMSPFTRSHSAAREWVIAAARAETLC